MRYLLDFMEHTARWSTLIPIDYTMSLELMMHVARCLTLILIDHAMSLGIK